MKEQLPLKRIFIGLVASVTAGVAVTAAGTVNETVLRFPGSYPYVIKSEAVSAGNYSAGASVVALNHEENTITNNTNNNDNNNITKLLDLTINLSAFKALTEQEEKEISETKETVTEADIDPVQVQDKYETEEWWKAELSDYTETFEQQELILTETEAAALPGGPIVIEASPAPVPEVPAVQGGVSLPDNLEANTFYFTSYGYGHGVGMSQNGANFYAAYAGYDYLQILQHYYPGTTVAYTPGAEYETISVRGYSGSVVDVISRVCNAEIGSSFDEEAIKAQAIAAYTYIKHAGGSTSGMAINTSSYPDQKIIDAVSSVLGQAVYYNDSYALTLFYASSGSATASCKDVLYEDIPYLRSVSCDYDAAYDTHYGEITSISVDSLRSKLQSAYGIYLSSDYTAWVQPVVGDGGYISDVVIDGQKTVDGYSFARAIGLKSGKFTVYYT